MKIVQGDIWDYHEKHWVVITTNIGWKSNGDNSMGAGLAKDAANRYPQLPAWYGEKCRTFKDRIMVLPHFETRLIMFPTKAFDPKQPWASWRQDSSIPLIEKSTRQLSLVADILESRGLLLTPIVVPMVGCKNGHLYSDQVLPILETLDDRFMITK